MTKTCFKCKGIKELIEFYPHKKNADGFLGKCKECTKEDVKLNRKKRINYYKGYDLNRHNKDYVRPVRQKKERHFSMSEYKRFTGTSSEYRGLHYWIEKESGKPTACEKCKRTGLSGRKIHWANKSGKYLKEKSDWERLCARCHMLKDGFISPKLLTHE